MPARAVHVVILNWNGGRMIEGTLEALRACGGSHLRVLVVDNGSTDGSADLLEERFDGVEVLRLPSNLGFAAGNDVGFQRAVAAGAEFVCFLNNDARLAVGDLLALVEALAEDPGAGAAAPIFRERRGERRVEIWGGGRVSLWTGLPWHLHGREEGPVDYLRGACLMVRVAAVPREGPFDPGFFFYWEDTDLSFRLRRDGWRLLVVEDAIVEHDGNGSIAFRSPERDRRFTASSIRFLRRHAPLPVVPVLVSVAGRTISRLLTGRWRNAAETLAGFREGWLGT